MDSRLSFGIGCFHFGVKRTPPFRFKGSEYIKELRTALQSIPNIDNINVDCDEEFEGSSFDITEELPNIKKGPGFFPIPNYMHIEFEMYIPFRIQAQLLERKVPTLRTFTEKFKVSMHYGYYLPVTFTEPIDPNQESTPSYGVRIVREFLKQEFKSSKSDYVRFECLGPSPFHADCYIQPGKIQGNDKADWTFEVKRFPDPGYDSIVFEFNPRVFAKAIEAEDVIMEEIQDELGFFYRIVQLEVVKMYDWARIRELVSQLITIQRIKGIKGFLKRLFEGSQLINEALTSIAEFESDEFDIHHHIQTNYRDICSSRQEPCLQFYIEKEIKERMSYPTKEIGQLVSFFESRRMKSVETLVVLVSAIVGAAIGALLGTQLPSLLSK